MVSRLAKSGIFLPEFHVPDFSRFLQHREISVQRDGIFVSINDSSLLSFWGGKTYPLIRHLWKISSKG